MDPTAALTFIRAMITAHKAGIPPTPHLVDTVDGLDRWLTGGGFLPEQWTMPDYYPLDTPIHDGVADEITDPAETVEAIRVHETVFSTQRAELLRLVAGLDRWILTNPGKLPAQWTTNRP